jgi:addiction module HigA family antidote
MAPNKKAMAPVHPGEILIEEFLKPLGITQYRLAKTIGVPQRRIGEIVQGNRGITADTALRLSRALRTTPQFWMNLQTRHDLECLGEILNDDLDRSIKPLVA